VIRVVVAGAGGRMGRLVCEAVAAADELELAARLHRGDDAPGLLGDAAPDVLVDFTLAEATRDLAPLAIEMGISPVIGTTGLTTDDVERVRRACHDRGVGAVLAANFAVGAVLQMQSAEALARHLPCTGIHEVHHPAKKDSPSGTARATAERLGRLTGAEPAIQSERREGVVSRQEVSFGRDGERVVLVHEVTDRRAFMPGVLLAVRRARGLPGLVVGIDALLG